MNQVINLKILYLLFFLVLESIFSLNYFVNSGEFKNFKNQKIFPENIKKDHFSVSFNDDLGKILKHNLLNSSNKLVNLISEGEKSIKEDSAVEIISDTKYQKDNKFVAEGNAVVYLKNGELKADKIIYDKIEEILIIEGNIAYFQGNQYFEASYLTFSFKENKGFLKDIYGVLDLMTFSDDTDYQLEGEMNFKKDYYDSYNLNKIKYENSANIGLENTFENDSGKKLNITELKFDVPQIQKWRFKANKILIENNDLFSEEIFFTNDPLNKPQFYIKSKNFSVKTINNKLRLISKNTRINFDDVFSFPIGRRRIINKEPISRWGFGSDYDDKDGFYLSRSFNSRKIFGNYDLQLTPYFLIQRALKGNTNSFVENNSSILSDKVTQDISLSDVFALDISMKGNIGSWDLNINKEISSLDMNKLPNSSRVLLTLDKTYDLNSKKINNNKERKYKDNFLDLQFYGAYRQKVVRDFKGDEEIYLGKGFTVSNRKSWQTKSSKNNFSINYDIGEFSAKEKSINNLKTLTRNVFASTYDNEFPIWQKQNLDKEIDISYRYSPEAIAQGLTWLSSVKSGIYFYSDGSQQNAISFSSGPRFILGSFKKNFLDYTEVDLQGEYIIKNGISPFAFDDIDKTQKINFTFKQQIKGPLLFGYQGFVNLDNNSDDYGKFSNNTYSLNIERRAYSLGAFYRESSKAFGIQFSLNNFNYQGFSAPF